MKYYPSPIYIKGTIWYANCKDPATWTNQAFTIVGCDRCSTCDVATSPWRMGHWCGLDWEEDSGLMETCLYSGYNPLHLWIYYYVMIYKYPKYIIGLQSVPYIEIPGFLKTRNLEDFVAGGGRVRELSCSQFRGVGAAQEKLFKLMVKPLLKYDIFRFIDSYMDNRKLHVLFCFVTNFVELQKWFEPLIGGILFGPVGLWYFSGWIPKAIPAAPGVDDNVKTACL